MSNNQLAGLLLFGGSVLILITIGFEVTIGWVEASETAEAIPLFIYDNWDGLKKIWGWQLIGQFLWTAAYLIFFKEAGGWKSLIWAVLFICGTMVVAGFLITLGSYYPALKVYAEMPALFDAIRGAVGGLYRNCIMASLCILLAVLFIEMFGKSGVVGKGLGLGVLGVVILTIILGGTTALSMKLMSASLFFIPLLIGLSYWRAK